MCITIVAVGDISFGDYPFCPGFGIRSSLAKGQDPFQEIKKELTDIDADLIFGNLETVLSDYGLDENDLSSWELRGNPSSLNTLRDTGFNILNLANNHIMQHGEVAFDETCANLHKQDIKVVGEKLPNSLGSKPVIISKRGITLGFLGYCFEEEKNKDIAPKYSYGKEAIIKEDIRLLRAKVDFVIVSCHWGLEFIQSPSPTTITLAHNMVDWGANLILGHHPHVLQGIEEYKNGLIVYSMGNFLFDMLWHPSLRQTALFSFKLEKNRPIQWDITPFEISKDYKLIKLHGDEKNNLIENYKTICTNSLQFFMGDRERRSYEYYLTFEKLRKKNRLKSYYYFLKNIFNIKAGMIRQILSRSIRDKLHHSSTK